jgi:hypothetical protein
VLKEIRPASLPAVTVTVALGGLSTIGAVHHCAQYRDSRACEVLRIVDLDSTPENAPANPMQGRPLVAMATTTSTSVISDFNVVFGV